MERHALSVFLCFLMQNEEKYILFVKKFVHVNYMYYLCADIKYLLKKQLKHHQKSKEEIHGDKSKNVPNLRRSLCLWTRV